MRSPKAARWRTPGRISRLDSVLLSIVSVCPYSTPAVSIFPQEPVLIPIPAARAAVAAELMMVIPVASLAPPVSSVDSDLPPDRVKEGHRQILPILVRRGAVSREMLSAALENQIRELEAFDRGPGTGSAEVRS